jgi:hypothetical protein
MSLSQLWKINMASLLAINPRIICLLIILQLAAWYPVLSEKHSQLESHVKHKNQTVKAWQAIQRQSNIIEKGGFLQAPWVAYSVGKKEHGVLTEWQVEGSASITEWQVLLEKVQEQFALGLISVHWNKGISGNWYGDLSFDIKTPRANREYSNWLPVKLQTRRFVAKDWRLLSTMRVGDKTSALLEYKRSRHWVYQGSWLPIIGLTVESVSFDNVTLVAKDGSQVALTVREIGGKHD